MCQKELCSIREHLRQQTSLLLSSCDMVALIISTQMIRQKRTFLMGTT